MTKNNTKSWSTVIKFDDYKNLALPMFPNTGQPIPFHFKFINNGESKSWSKFDSKGHCTNSVFRGHKFVSEIYVELNFSACLESDEKIDAKALLQEIQHTITHEIAHAQDDLLLGELKNYKKKEMTSDEDLKYLTYWLKPTEIRSHMNEMIHVINSKRYYSPKRTFKNMYKTAARAEEFGMKHTEEDKERMKTAFSMLNKSQSSKTQDDKSKDALMTVLNRSFHGNCPKLTKQFIFDYHISFIKYSNPSMKQRYYDNYFDNTEAQPLEKMDDFFEGIKTVTRSFTKLKKEILKQVNVFYKRTEEEKKMIMEFNDISEKLWDDSILKDAFQNYDTKLLKKLGKQIVEEFREKWGLMTKGMMTKAAKAYTKQLEKEYREKHGSGAEGMEDFFNSDPSSVRR